MTWRTVVISQRAKLDLKMNHLVIRQGGSSNRVYIGEIALLIIESTAVSLTAALISELSKQKVKVIFCDPARNPHSELMSYYGSHNTSLRIKEQINWKDKIKKEVWTEVIKEKIYHQMSHLNYLGKAEYKLLQTYIGQVEVGDRTNREGHAAKVYFNALIWQAI